MTLDLLDQLDRSIDQAGLLPALIATNHDVPCSSGGLDTSRRGRGLRRKVSAVPAHALEVQGGESTDYLVDRPIEDVTPLVEEWAAAG